MSHYFSWPLYFTVNNQVYGPRLRKWQGSISTYIIFYRIIRSNQCLLNLYTLLTNINLTERKILFRFGT